MPERKKTTGMVNKNEPIPIPSSANAIHLDIIKLLKELNNHSNLPCITTPFLQAWKELLALFEQYQQEISSVSSLQVTCTKGCAACCCHWVDEVYSFEAEILADFLKKNHKEQLSRIIDCCREDIAIIDQLKGLVGQKLSVIEDKEQEGVDDKDLLLSVFYQMNRPCPLLEKGVCIAYHIRPLMCRGYVSFSNSRYCGPEFINSGDAATYLFSLEDEALELVESLDKKFAKFEGEIGLRALLIKYLDK
jgi:Fe-S-cluster containining protein